MAAGFARTMLDHYRRCRVIVVVGAMLAIATGCGDSDGHVAFKPVLIPVKITWGAEGMRIEGEAGLVTPVGTFSINANYALQDVDDNAIYVILRNRGEVMGNEVGFDRIYKINSGAGSFNAVVNGTTAIQVVKRQVLIDVTDGNIKEIQFTGAQMGIREYKPGISDKWNKYWSTGFYRPFVLSRWAYDDSTIGNWFGLGFLWFALRLLLALLLGLVDLALTCACLLAAAAFVLFGTTGRNIVYGLEFLVTLFILNKRL